jgi:hypothetical protein
MIDQLSYGDSPKVVTVANTATTVAGVKARVLETTSTLSQAFIKKSHTKVRSEKLWIVALQIGANDVSLWYISVPDLVKSLWPRVPSIIATIRLS